MVLRTGAFLVNAPRLYVCWPCNLNCLVAHVRRRTLAIVCLQVKPLSSDRLWSSRVLLCVTFSPVALGCADFQNVPNYLCLDFIFLWFSHCRSLLLQVSLECRNSSIYSQVLYRLHLVYISIFISGIFNCSLSPLSLWYLCQFLLFQPFLPSGRPITTVCFHHFRAFRLSGD